MTKIEKMSSEETVLRKFEKVDDESQRCWDIRLANVKGELQTKVADYIHEERSRSARIAELSKTKMLG